MLYFSYGSNISETRLNKRIKNYRTLHQTELKGYEVKFIKRSKDGSGKATLVENSNSTVLGMLYDIDSTDFKILDKIEGVEHGYDKVVINGYLTYVASETYINTNLLPYDWYLYLILDGMISNKFPQDYIDKFNLMETIKDNDKIRAFEHYGQLQNFNMSINLGNYLGSRIQTYFIIR